jgi:hypothetical protein
MPKLSSFFDKPFGTNKDNNGKIRKTPHLINNWQIHVYCKGLLVTPNSQ